MRCLLALLAAACTGGPPDDTGIGLGCDGADTTWARIGFDGELGFAPLEDGDAIAVLGGDDPHLRMDFQIGGLDAAEPVSVVVRLGVGDDPTSDLLANATLSCAGDGPAEYGALAGLTETPPEGTPVRIDAVFTDHAGRVAETGVDVVIGP
jgi:hypothetical protein